MSSRRGPPNFSNSLDDDDQRLPVMRRAALQATLGMWRDRTDSDKRLRELLYILDALGLTVTTPKNR